jgi:hypothetical protein
VNREVFRLAPPLILWWVWVVFAVANVADFVLQGASARFSIVVSAILLTITGLAYTLALRPRVIAEPAGLTIVNPFRDHHVPWAAIQAVDTGEWVRVHYAPAQASPAASSAVPASPAASSAVPASPAASPAVPTSSAASEAISCWALYLSARTKRRAARIVRAGPPASLGAAGPPGFARAASRPRPRGILPRGFGSTATDMLAASRQEPGYAENARLPEEAKYLASLPAAKAIAFRLDSRAARERAGREPGNLVRPVTARWAWPPIAAVGVPALGLLIAAVAF